MRIVWWHKYHNRFELWVQGYDTSRRATMYVFLTRAALRRLSETEYDEC